MRGRQDVHGAEGRGVRLLQGIVVLAVLLAVLPSVLRAQGTLNFKRVINNWPTIELYLSAGCNGTPRYFNDPSQFRVYENGREITDFTLWCPDPVRRCAASLALVLDASGSMMGGRSQALRDAAHVFVDLLDPATDEAAVIQIADSVRIAQSMTTDHAALASSITVTAAFGRSVGLDGLRSAIDLLVADAVNPCRAVVFVSDGRLDSSSATLEEVVARAIRYRIRIFCIGIDVVDQTTLMTIAARTGGVLLLNPSVWDLSTLYGEMTTLFFTGEECVIFYNTSCADGATRIVNLVLKDFCGSDHLQTKSYRAILDTSQHTQVRLAFATDSYRGGARGRLPLSVTAWGGDGSIPPFELGLRVDPPVLQIRGLLLEHTLIENAGATVTSTADGVRIRTTREVQRNGAVPLLALDVETADLPAGVESVVHVSMDTVVVAVGCVRVVTDQATIPVFGRAAELVMELDAPDTLIWDPLRGYVPDTITVCARVWNAGDRVAEDPVATIALPPGLMLDAGESASVHVARDGLTAGDTVVVCWKLRAAERLDGDTARVCVDVVARYGRSARMCRTIGGLADAAIIVEGPLTFCEGGAVTLHATPGYDSVRWSTGARGPRLVADASGAYLWSARDRRGRMVVAPPVTVTVLPAPAPVVTLAHAGPFCEGDSVQATVTDGYVRYEWNDGVRQRSRHLRAPGAYVVTVQTADGCVAQSDTVRVAAVEMPVPVIFGPTRSCVDEVALFTTSVPPGTSCIWNTTNGSILYGQGTDHVWIQWQSAAPTLIHLSATRDGSMCVRRTEHRVTVEPNARPWISMRGACVSCLGDSVVLEARGIRRSLLWSTGAMTSTITVRTNGAYFVSDTEPAPCGGDSDTLLVRFVPRPLPGISGPANADQGSVASYRTDSIAGRAWAWSVIGGRVLGFDEDAGVRVEWGEVDTGFVIVREGNGGCVSTDTLRVLLRKVVGVDVPAVSALSLSVWPEPVGSVMTVELRGGGGVVLATVHDLLGREWVRVEDAVEGVWRRVLDVSALPPGAYVLRVMRGGVVQARVVVRR